MKSQKRKKVTKLDKVKPIYTALNWSPWPTHSHGLYWSLFSHLLSVHAYVPTFQNIAKQNKFQAKTIFTTGETMALAEWIIDYICLGQVIFLYYMKIWIWYRSFVCHDQTRTLRRELQIFRQKIRTSSNFFQIISFNLYFLDYLFFFRSHANASYASQV